MKPLILGGLSIALGCLVAQVHAEEVQWRPARAPSAQAVSPAVPPGQQPAVALRPPLPLTATPPAVVPVNYLEPLAPAGGQLLVSKDNPQTTQPLPLGPSLGGPALDKKIEVVPIPPPSVGPTSQVPFPGVIHYDTFQTDPKGVEVAPAPKVLTTAPPYTTGSPLLGLPDGMGMDSTCDGCACGSSPIWSGGCCETGCDACGCGPGMGCGVPRFYARGEYLLWGMKNPHIPTLVTTTSLNNAALLAMRAADPNFRPGALGQNGTVSLLDQNNFHEPMFSGGRFTAGVGGICNQWGLEGSFFFLGRGAANASFSSQGTPGLFRPFDNVTLGLPDAQLVALGSLAGTVDVHEASQMWGLEANVRRNLLCDCNYKLDLLAGFRYLQLWDNLQIHEGLNFTKDVPNGAGGFLARAGDRIDVFDGFRTRNDFYGGQVGLDFEWKLNRWVLGASTKVALGSVHQQVEINGATIFTPAGGAPVVGAGGLLAQPTNSNIFSRDRFAVVPELGLKVGYQLNDHLTAFVAYNFLYISNVVRPGDQIDTGINTTQIPASIPRSVAGQGNLVGAARPAFVFHSVDHWAQGANVGLEWKY